MDYLQQSIVFKIKKVMRYISLYGLSRTYMKVLGQLHTRKEYKILPENNSKNKGGERLGLIGCGNYAFTTIGYFLKKRFGRIIAVCMDVDINKAASMSDFYKIPVYTTKTDDIMNNDNVEMVYIASYHSSHAEYAIQALQKGKHVYIEKPHVVSMEQLVRLVNTMETTRGKVFLGFNRPFSRFGKTISDFLEKETGPGIYNWFIAGHDLEPDHWYHRKEEGGRILGNLCHWTDFVLRLVPACEAFPIKIIPARADKSDTDVAVSFVFNDNTVAVISFSAKGHAFEGVKERFTAYKGNTMIAMDDFKTMEINVINKKKTFKNFYRDHGHSKSIVAAADNVFGELPYNREKAIAHIWNTGLLFLETKRALETQETITIYSYEDHKSKRNENTHSEKSTNHSKESFTTSDVLQIPSVNFNSMFSEIPAVQRFQLIQWNLNEVEIRIKSQDLNEYEKDKILNELTLRLGHKMKIKLTINKKFERNPEGKRRPVISHVRTGERIETSPSV